MDENAIMEKYMGDAFPSSFLNKGKSLIVIMCMMNHTKNFQTSLKSVSIRDDIRI